MKRRIFIKAVGATATTLGFSQLSTQARSHDSGPEDDRFRETKNDETEADVVVVGAGISGLCAARELVKNHLSVLVVEARLRAGGRTHNEPVNTTGAVIEGGGQWVGPTQTEILALADELDIDVFETWNTGEVTGLFEGLRLVGSELDSSAEVIEDLRRVIAKIDEMAATVPLHAPWDAVNASAWDAQKLGDWLDANTLTLTARYQLESEVSSILGDSSAEISLLWFLFYIHSAGGYEVLQTIEGGAQQYRFVGGAQQVSVRLAEELGLHRIIYGNPVKHIISHHDKYFVQLENGIVEAKQVVVAMMPADVNKIMFTPSLPAPRANLQTNWTTSSGFKISVVYSSAFWRNAGLNGQATTDTAVGSVFDNSPPSGTPGILVAFVDAEQLPTDKNQRMQQVVEILTQLFGSEASSPIEYIEMDWAKEQFTEGCESPLGTNVLTRYGQALRPSVGRIHWAGTETSLIWNGYMEGAVRAGKQAAANVMASMD